MTDIDKQARDIADKEGVTVAAAAEMLRKQAAKPTVTSTKKGKPNSHESAE